MLSATKSLLSLFQNTSFSQLLDFNSTRFTFSKITFLYYYKYIDFLLWGEIHLMKRISLDRVISALLSFKITVFL